MKTNMLIEKFFTSNRKHALYLLVFVNCSIFILHFGIFLYLNAASLLSNVLAVLLPGLFFLIGFKEYRQQHHQETRLDNISIVIGAGFSVLLLFQMLNINWIDFQMTIVDVLVFGGLCSFTKDHVLELVKIHSLEQLIL